MVSWAHPSPYPKRHLVWFSHFAQLAAESPYNITMGHPSPPLKIPPLHGGSGLLSNTWFFGPSRVNITNSTVIGPATFAGLTIMTDRTINRPCYSVCNSRSHLASAAMQPTSGEVDNQLRPKKRPYNIKIIYLCACLVNGLENAASVLPVFLNVKSLKYTFHSTTS